MLVLEKVKVTIFIEHLLLLLLTELLKLFWKILKMKSPLMMFDEVINL